MKKFDSKRNAMVYWLWGKQNLKKFDSKRNAKFYFLWGKQNLKRFDSKRNAKFYFLWGKQNLKKFDSSSKENWRNGDYAASVIRVAALGKTLGDQQPQGIVFKEDSSHE